MKGFDTKILAGVLLFLTLGATSPIAAQFDQVTKITATVPHDYDNFGYSVALSGQTALVGADGVDGAGRNRGAAYLYEEDHGGTDNWGEVKMLTASDAANGDLFGTSVALDQDTAVVGARFSDAVALYSGAAYVFDRDHGGLGNWGEVTRLTGSDTALFDYFGISVAISGQTAIVGAYGAEGRRGAAYIFERDQGGMANWGQVAKLTASDGSDDDEFGISVGISGSTAIVGAHYAGNGGYRQGAAYVFERDQGGVNQWGEVVKLTASDISDDDWFGHSVAVLDDRVLVGASQENGAGLAYGAAYVFERNQGGVGNWGPVAKLTAAEARNYDQLGVSVALFGDMAIAGAYGRDDAGMHESGAAYIFGRDEGGLGNWGQVAKLTACDAQSTDEFGYAVGLSGTTAIAGAHQEGGAGSERGAAYIYSEGLFHACDFDQDGDCDLDDLDAMLLQGPVEPGIPVIKGVNDQFDLRCDGTIDNTDVDQWLARAAILNGLGSPFKRGDANLDGAVDGTDFNLWNSNKFTSNLLWENGDWNGDGLTDGADFGVWNANKFTQSDRLPSVPEPSSWAVLFMAATAALARKPSEGMPAWPKFKRGAPHGSKEHADVIRVAVW